MDLEQLMLEVLGIRTKPANAGEVPDPALAGQLNKPGLYEADPGYSTPNADLGYPTVTLERPRTSDPTFSDVTGPGESSDLMTILRDNQNDPAVEAEIQSLLAPAQDSWNQERQGIETHLRNSQSDAEFLQELLNRPGGGPAAQPQGPSMTDRPYNASPPPPVPYPNTPQPAVNPLQDPSTAFAHLDRAGPPLRRVGPRPTIAAPPQAPPPLPGPSAPQYAHLDSQGQGFSPNPAPTGPRVDLSVVPPGGSRPSWLDAPIAPLPQNSIIGANPRGPYQTVAPPDPFGAPGNTPPPMIPAPASEVAPFRLPFDVNRPAVLQLNETQRAPQQAPAPNPVVAGRTPGLLRTPAPAAAPAPAPQAAPLQSDILNRAELQRFLDANPMMPQAPAPSAPTVTTPQTPPIPPQNAAQNPTPAPKPGQALPTALKEQLLAEAFRLTQERRGLGPSPPAR